MREQIAADFRSMFWKAREGEPGQSIDIEALVLAYTTHSLALIEEAYPMGKMIKRLKLLWWVFNPYWFWMPLFEDIGTRYKYLPYEFSISTLVLIDNVKRLIQARFNPEIYETLENREDNELLARLYARVHDEGEKK